jgi:hypothetical protein
MKINKITNKKINKTINRIIAIFISVLIVSMTFTISFSLSSTTVKADEQVGCCELTRTQLICQETERGNCQSGFHSGQACSQINTCKPGTCVPPKGRCMAQKMKAECDAILGFWVIEQMENIQVCQKGCCGIAEGIKAEVLQRKECNELALELGYDPEEDVEFDTSITRQDECFKKYATQDRGCCVLGGGQCEYGIREQCTQLAGNFVPLAGNRYCKDVQQCAATPHAYYDCGELPGTEFDIYWYDSQGSQEEVYDDCNYPNALCTKDKTGQVECKSTTCFITGRAQKMSDNPPKIEWIDFNNKLLLTGQSTCYNFYTHYDGQEDNELYERSTGLQNQILHCRLGDIEIEALGPDREELCADLPGEPHAIKFENNWEECPTCGSGGSLDFIGDFFGPFPPFGKLFNNMFGEYCDRELCEDSVTFGDCVYKQEFGGFLGGVPVGACVPKYPPGTTASGIASQICALCGKEAGLWNLCDRQECEAFGDCYFEPYGAIEGGLKFLLIAVSTYIVGRFVWLPMDCAAYAFVNSVGVLFATYPAEYTRCLSVRSNSWWFKSVTLPVKLVGWITKSPLATVATVLGVVSSIAGISSMFKK